MSDCPSRDELIAFTTGRLTVPAADAIAGHLAECRACQETLAGLDSISDPVIAALRNAQSAPSLDVAQCQRAVARVMALNQADGDHGSGGLSRQLRCPHCRTRIELPAQEPAGELACGSCGESFAVAMPGPLPRTSDARSRRIAHFELLDCLGEGAFGAVWKARDVRLGRTVALKIPRPGCGAAIQPLLREARIAAGLRHPHIVGVLEVGFDGDPPYIASEYIDGENLAETLQEKPLAPREAAGLLLRLAEALAVAHAAGVIHRDLKPQNILMDRAGCPHVGDFGLAHAEVENVTVTLEGRILGTPAYMSPEQARGQDGGADARSDLYSLGVIFYELLTGRVPFHGDLRTLVAKILFEEPVSPRAVNRHVPRDLETICLKCLEKRPARRYASAAALADDLRRFLAGEPIAARAVPRWEHVGRWCARRPLVAGLWAIVVGLSVSLLATASVGWWQQREANRRAEESLYILEIASAQRRWLANDKIGAQASLDACPEAFRNLEWRLMQHVAATPQRRLRGAGRSVEFSPVGEWMATSTNQNQAVAIWNARTLQLRRFVAPQPGTLVDLDISPDGALLLTTSQPERAARLWNLVEGKLKSTLGPSDRSAWHARFSPDGSRFISYGDQHSVHVWDARLRQELLAFGGGALIETMAVAPVGSRVALATGRPPTRVTIWDYSTGQRVQEIPTHGAAIVSLEFSPDGRLLALGERLDSVHIWQCEPKHPLLTIAGPLSEAPCLTFDPAGQRLAGEGADNCLHVWDVATGRELQTFRGYVPPVGDIAFSPDGRYLAGSGAERIVYLWDAAAEQGTIPLLSVSAAPLDLKMSPTGQFLATAYDNGVVRIWQVDRRTIARDIKAGEGSVRALDFSPDERHLVAGGEDGVVRVFDLATGRLVREWGGHDKPLRAVAYSPEGRRIASAGLGLAVLIHDARTGVLQTRWKMERAVRSIAWNREGTRLAGGDRGGHVVVWNVSSGETVWKALLPSRVWSMAWDSNGDRLAIARGDGLVRLCQAEDGLTLTEFCPPGDENLVQIAFSPDGSRLAVATEQKNVVIREIPGGRLVLTPSSSPLTAAAVAFDPRGRYLATALTDGTVRLWPTGE